MAGPRWMQEWTNRGARAIASLKVVTTFNRCWACAGSSERERHRDPEGSFIFVYLTGLLRYVGLALHWRDHVANFFLAGLKPNHYSAIDKSPKRPIDGGQGYADCRRRSVVDIPGVRMVRGSRQYF